MRYVVPIVTEWPRTVVAVNIGGAVIPTFLSLFLVMKNEMERGCYGNQRGYNSLLYAGPRRPRADRLTVVSRVASNPMSRSINHRCCRVAGMPFVGSNVI
jgi:Protein of unknown function (DUF1614)